MTDPSPAASKSLLLSRRFAPLFWCQFFSAFSDNFLKNALAFLIVFHIGGSLAEPLTQLAAAVFIAPYFFLSAFGGQMADRYDKAIVARRLKLAEIGISVIAIIGFAIHSVPLLFAALFGFGVIGSPDQIWHLARPARQVGIASGQRIGRGRHLHGDPARHHRRRIGGERWRRSGVVLRPHAGVRAVVLGVEPADPEGRFRRARPRDLDQHRPLHR